ncbi:tetratricopeptide repeat protein [Geofilum rhodophaeum]|uniref:tetratricopeptide repeat protein n=1 Tax=Geofilum rhodophaeum TaxID=1965019 RepID=UPI001314DE7C|nr:tetratricopeptide repeat protein [Geofilum rhodophaeum]
MKYVRLLFVGLSLWLCFPILSMGGQSSIDELSLCEDLIIEALEVNPEEADRLIASLYELAAYDSVFLSGMVAYYEGELAYVESRWKDAAQAYESAAEVFEKIKDGTRAAASFNNMGLVHSYMGNYDRALWAYEQSLKVELELDNRPGIAECYQNMAIVFAAGEQSDKALRFYDKALEVYEEQDMQESAAAIYNNKAVLFAGQGDFESAETNYRLALAIYGRLRASVLEARVLSNLGALSLRQGKYDGVGSLLERALFLFKAEGDRIGEVKVYGMLGDLYNGRKDYMQAVFLYQMAIKQAGTLEMKDVEAENQFSLYNTYKAAAMPAEALKAYEDYVAMRDRMIRDNPEFTKGLISKELEQEIAERDLLLFKARTRTVWFAVGLGLMVLVSSGAFWMLRKRKRRMEAHREMAKNRKVRMRERLKPGYVLTLLQTLRDCLDRGDVDCARQRLDGVALLMQNILENSCESLISVRAEMEYVERYLLVQKQQLDIDLDFRIETNLQQQAEHIMVPAMFTQPFIEQTFQGVGAGDRVVVNIAFVKRNQLLEVVIENNLPLPKPEERRRMETSFRALGASVAQEQSLSGNALLFHPEEWGGVQSETFDPQAEVGNRLRFNLPLMRN